MEVEKEFVRFEVRDDGAGMSEAVLSRALDPFFTTKTRGEGAGLGLPLVVSTAHSHHGALRIWSTEDEGSTIALFVPSTDKTVQTPERPGGSFTDFPGTEVVLIVDDESIVRKVARRALERCGYEVLEVEDGREGIEVVKSRWVTWDWLSSTWSCQLWTAENFSGRSGNRIPKFPSFLIRGSVSRGGSDSCWKLEPAAS